jgi:hypothetical protein
VLLVTPRILSGDCINDDQKCWRRKEPLRAREDASLVPSKCILPAKSQAYSRAATEFVSETG